MTRSSASSPPPRRFPEDLGVALACPDCRSALLRREDVFICRNGRCRRQYAIDQGIPRFLVSESTVLETGAWEQALRDAR